MRTAALVAAVVLPLLMNSEAQAQRTAASPEAVRAAIDAHRRGHEMAVMEELRTLLELPNVASDAEDIRRNAALLVRMLERRGVDARVLDVDGAPPSVYGELRVPGATRTVMLYAHFDGQPVDEVEWATPPWTPTLRAGRLQDGAAVVDWNAAQAPLDDDWRVYARSASDDKSPIVAYLAALDALRAAGIAPSVNLKFFLEGEEEAGSPHLRALLQRHRALLGADVWIFGDGPVHQTGRMQVVYGVRGITGVELTVYGPTRAVHSGHYGNWAPNPAAMLTQLVASLRDDNGVVRIDGFYDDVRPPSAAEREALAALPAVEDALVQELALGRTEGDGERLMNRILLPALNVTGLSAGGVGTQRRNAVPTEATVAIDIRLVPDMSPSRVRQQLDAQLRTLGYHVVREAPTADVLRAHPRVVRMTWDDGYAAVRTPLDLPVARAVARVVDDMFDEATLRVPMLGGSLPLAIFEQVLGAPLIIVPMVNADNNQHAANENLRIGNFWSGVLTYAGLMARLGAAWDEDPGSEGWSAASRPDPYVSPAQGQVDEQEAAAYMAEIEMLCKREGGRLWGVSLCGPVVMADPATGTIATNRPEPDAPRPHALGYANAAMQWGDDRWVTLVWPFIPADPAARGIVFLHELFHRVQPDLGLYVATSSGENDHLDTPEGRYWMQLEWRALARALETSGSVREEAVRDALAFRMARRTAFPAAAEREAASEINEGLAQYTATVAAAESAREAGASAVRQLRDAPDRESFVRTFAYASGAAYGLLLDDAFRAWRETIQATDDLGTMLMTALAIGPTEAPHSAAARYDGPELRAMEEGREAERQARIEDLRRRFVDGPVLVLPRGRNASFITTGVTPIPGEGTIYPRYRVTGEWGTIEAEAVLVSPDGTTLTVPAPKDLGPAALAGEGWRITLAEGWTVQPGTRPGDFRLLREK